MRNRNRDREVVKAGQIERSWTGQEGKMAVSEGGVREA